ncbi:hypothetical protein PsYK624_125240 [Phanerochaete sordida]|uniref:Uncharacterized protein n=1 Tax=Phanerochaete sordida TaxID=48140 RepID=A0A9P3GMS4_9APHY|nr:hypothetical protein PsYK624_125240 [Phanerochaete sordida]
MSYSDHHFEHAIDLISHFSHISSLYVDGETYSAQLLRPPTPQRQIRADTFAVLCKDEIDSTGLQALFQHADLDATRSLVIFERSFGLPSDATGLVLQAAIRSCRHLRSLTCGDDSFERALAHPLPIPTLRELRTHTGRGSSLAEHWAKVASLACSPLASTVRTLVVSMEYSRTVVENDIASQAAIRADVGSVDWSAVNLALTDLPALRVLDVVVEVEMHNDVWAGTDFMMDRMRFRDSSRMDPEEFRVMVEDAVQAGLLLAPNQTLELSVSIRDIGW